MTYNISSVENATNFASLFSGIDSIVGGFYLTSFFALIWVVTFISVEGDAPVKSIIASFVTLVLSAGTFFGGVGGEQALIVSSSLLFLSLLWKMNT